MNKPAVIILVIGLSVVGVLGGLTLYDNMKEVYGSGPVNSADEHKPPVDQSRIYPVNPLCTAGNPTCHPICGDHLCAPGETPRLPTK